MAAVSQALRDDLLASIPNLRAFAVSLTGNGERADDLVQETLMKAWAKFHTFQEGTNLRAWLFTILRNEFYSQLRKRGREVEDAEGTYAARLASQPAQGGHMDMTTSARRSPIFRPTSARRSSSSAPPVSPTTKRRRSAAVPSAPSRAA